MQLFTMGVKQEIKQFWFKAIKLAQITTTMQLTFTLDLHAPKLISCIDVIVEAGGGGGVERISTW